MVACIESRVIFPSLELASRQAWKPVVWRILEISEATTLAGEEVHGAADS